MIMRINNFENDIALSEEYIRVLEIEDKALFANIIESIYSLCNGEESNEYILILKEDENIDFIKDVYLVLDILNIDFNDKNIVSKLYKNIKTSIDQDLEIKEKLEAQFRDTFNYLDTILVDLPFEFNYKTELKIEDLIKFYGIKLYSTEKTFIEKVLYLIDLISLLNLCEVLVFCNMKSFFTENQMEEIYKHILHNKLKIILIEGNIVDELLKYERKIRIDSYFEDYEVN